MKKIPLLILCCILLAGCGGSQPSEVQQTTAESSFNTTSTSTEIPVISVPEDDPEPELYCEYGRKSVVNFNYFDYITAVNELAESMEFQGSLLISWNGTIVMAKGYGFSDEMTGDTCNATDTYEIGSVSKQMTAAAIMQLDEQDMLSVNDTIDKYFPEFSHAKNITIKNLLQMRSGLMDFINSPAQFFPEDFYEEYVEKADLDDSEEGSLPRDFVLDYIEDAPLCYGVDECFFYSNTNYYLLGLIIEQVTGETYQEYIQRELFDRCNMQTANNDFRATTARGYYYDGTSESMALSTSLGCGSVNASVYDLYQWARHLKNGTVVSKRSYREMTDAVDDYGYGIRVVDGIKYHTGNTDVFNAFLAVYDDSFIVVALTNKPKSECVAANFGAELHPLFAEVCFPDETGETDESTESD